LGQSHRLLLVEQLDAIGASTSDVRPRAQHLRNSGLEVRTLAIAPEGDDDLQHGTSERPQPGLDCFSPIDAAERVNRTAAEWHADAIVWVSATRGGGEIARSLSDRAPAWWWPSGWSAAREAGPLSPFAPGLTPADASPADAERGRTSRLSLWDGPYALVATPMAAGEAEELFDAFARAADQRDEVDLVVLDRHDAALERLARSAGLEQRVHFVGRAPREAENAWVQNARVSFVTLAEPLSAGLVRRSLGSGCPLLAVGRDAEPVSDWLRAHGVSWSRPGAGRLAWDSVADALHRTPAVETAIQRGRALVAHGLAAEVTTRLRAALAGAQAKRDRAA